MICCCWVADFGSPPPIGTATSVLEAVAPFGPMVLPGVPTPAARRLQAADDTVEVKFAGRWMRVPNPLCLAVAGVACALGVGDG